MAIPARRDAPFGAEEVRCHHRLKTGATYHRFLIPARRDGSNGFSLIEVMITIVNCYVNRAATVRERSADRRRTHRFLTGAARNAFSLIEVMIAIVILGFGLVMVATMYPVAWNRARVLTEQSMQGSIADTSEQLLKNVLHVDGLRKVATPGISDAGSFAGDMVLFLNDTVPPGAVDILFYGDTRVHALHMENLAITGGSLGRRFYPYRGDPNQPNPPKDSHPYRLEQLANQWINDEEFGFLMSFGKTGFGAAQIRFEDRFFPPLPPRKDVDGRGVFDPSKVDEQWEEILDTRRFAYAVFHRQRGYAQAYNAALGQSVLRIVGPDAPIPPAMTTAVERLKAVEDRYRERTFDFYIVTLRRAQSTYRFMQQDPNPRNTPDPTKREMPVNVQGLGPEHDVALPSPWRVQIFIPADPPDITYELRPGSNPSVPDASEGSPSIVYLNDRNFKTTSTFIFDMFQEGTWFIDEWNGEVYQVTSRRIENVSGVERAVLTLDREITRSDLDDLCLPPPGSCNPNGTLEPEGQEQLRSVWVFPPPIQGRNGAKPIFEGDSPVVGIEVRTLTFAPRP